MFNIIINIVNIIIFIITNIIINKFFKNIITIEKKNHKFDLKGKIIIIVVVIIIIINKFF